MEHTAPDSGTRRAIEWLILLVTCVIIVQGFFAFRTASLLFDEVGHYCQIVGFLQGTWRAIDCHLVTLPGFHITVAALLKVAGASSLPAARTAAFLLHLTLCVPVVLIVRSLHKQQAFLRALQVCTFPILLPFFPLLYTDVLALTLVLWALWAAMGKRSLLSALVLTAAIAVRQNAILWVPLLVAILAGEDRREKNLRRSAPYLLPLICVGALLLFNGGVSLNRSAVTPAVSFSLGNVFFALFLFTGLFLPIVIGRLERMAALLTHRRWVGLLIVAFALLFALKFTVTHPINQLGAQLRDAILYSVMTESAPRVLFFFSTVLALLTLLLAPLERRSFLLLYPLAFVSLSTIWMIETRYALVPLVLFALLRKSQSWRMELIQVAYNFAVLVWVFQ